MKVVALAFGVRPVDHSDRAGESNHLQCRGGGGPVVHRHDELAPPGLVQQVLDTARKGWAHRLVFGDAAPVAGRGDGARVGGEPDQSALRAVLFAGQLADRQLAVCRHLGRPGITDVGIVRPHDDPGRFRSARAVEVGNQGAEGLRHMCVAHVPGCDPAGEHAAVVGLSVADRHRVLSGVE